MLKFAVVEGVWTNAVEAYSHGKAGRGRMNGWTRLVADGSSIGCGEMSDTVTIIGAVTVSVTLRGVKTGDTQQHDGVVDIAVFEVVTMMGL